MDGGKQNENRPPVQSRWMGSLDSREHSQIYHAKVYARDHQGAGVPGHGQFLLIAKLVAMLDWLEGQSPAVDHSLLTPATPPIADPSRPPDTSKKPKGFV